jgi:glycosyltransferase involved in cell wall biosynthesis
MTLLVAPTRSRSAPSAPPPSPLRALVLAFDCHPTLPSLPVVTYNVCKELARCLQVTVVSRRQDDGFSVPGAAATDFMNVEALKRPLDGIADLLRGGRSVGWTTKTAFTYPTYLAFEYAVWRRYRQALASHQFDVVLRLSPMSPVLPSPMARWCPVPFVVGPVNGGLPFPKQVHGALAREREWLNPLRSLSRYFPYARSSYRAAAAILVGFQHTVDRLPADTRDKMIPFPEIGYDPELFYPLDPPPPSHRIRFVFVGRLVANKCADVLVEAFARNASLRQHELVLVGDGPERGLIEARIEGHRLQSCVSLVGAKSQQEVGQVLRSCHVFAFPSIRELGAGVVIEAMASGLPCVVVDSGAPGSLVDSSRGSKVPLGPRDAMADHLAEAMASLAADRQRWLALRAAALQFATAYTWQRKAENLREVLNWVTGRQPVKPNFYPL